MRAAQEEATSPQAKVSRKRRQHVMEGNFADAANNHGLKRARWRGMWRQRIQSCMIAAVQNLRILIRRGGNGPGSGAGALSEASLKSSGVSLPAFGTWSPPRWTKVKALDWFSWKPPRQLPDRKSVV